MKNTATLIALALSMAELHSQEEVKKAAPPAPADAPAKSTENRIKVGPVTVTTRVSSEAKTVTTKQTAYLGVVTGAVTAPVRAQVGLPEGMGLSVEAVAKGSPAEKAGLKQFDVLKKFNDQMLCTSDQLAALVGVAGKDAKVSLTIVRNGGEQTVPVTLEEHTVNVPAIRIGGTWSPDGGPQVDIRLDDLSGSLKGLGIDSNQFTLQLQEQLKNQQKDIGERLKDVQKKVDEASRRAREAAERRGDAQAKVFSFRPGSKASSQSDIIVKDGDGEIRIHEANGKSTLHINDAEGKEVYTGALDNDKDYEAVPEKFREKVRNAAKDMKKTGDKAEGKKVKGESV